MPKSRLTTCVTVADGDALREAPPDAARDQQVADLDLVRALHVLRPRTRTSSRRPIPLTKPRAPVRCTTTSTPLPASTTSRTSTVSLPPFSVVPTTPSGERTGRLGPISRDSDRATTRATRKNSAGVLADDHARSPRPRAGSASARAGGGGGGSRPRAPRACGPARGGARSARARFLLSSFTSTR